ncbi:MAG: glycosyltransferase [Armatimonadetes bacterium]|nr:glycosyltransferase [Armatimonadota bacterium]
MSVFHDPSGRRAVRLKQTLAASGAILSASAALFLLSVLFVPAMSGGRLWDQPRRLGGALLHVRRSLPGFELARHRERVVSAAAASHRPVGRPAGAGAPVVAAYFEPWEDMAVPSFRRHAPSLTHIFPVWLRMTPAGDGIDDSDADPEVNPRNASFTAIARQHAVAVWPVLSNAEGGKFRTDRIARLLHDEALQTRLAERLRGWLKARGLQGLNVDLEQLPVGGEPLYAGLLRRFASVLHPAGLGLAVNVEPSSAAVMGPLLGSCDLIVLMAYDFHDDTGTAGPIAPVRWVASTIRGAVRRIDPNKLVIGVGNYAYDWVSGKAGAEPLTFHDGLLRASDNRPDEAPETVIDFDAAALQSTFEYADDAGRQHEVWMLDAASAFNSWQLARQAGCRGVAIWAMGSEDPGIWDFARPQNWPPTPLHPDLSRVAFPGDVDNTGRGEIVRVELAPKTGRRTTTQDPATGLIVDQQYHAFPSTFVVQHRGYRPGVVALTFDDGPSERYTGAILDELKRLKAPASFFVVGESVEKWPDLVRRMSREGHDVGSHTYLHPNLGTVSDTRIELELNACQRAIESVLRRSTILFRPPYNADANPDTADEVRPLEIASKLGYVVVGEAIDPLDWDVAHGRSAEDIARRMVQGVLKGQGNSVLLHDGGGDRSRTVAALALAVPQLRRAGYRFVTSSSLAGLTQEQAMPLLSARQRAVVMLDEVVFRAYYDFLWVLMLAFGGGVILGVARVVVTTVLACVGAHRPLPPPLREPGPLVSVLIAAFNEEKTVAGTIASVLASDYRALEVIVVDDGSTDRTSEVVLAAFGADPRVRLVRQENAGKAAALNRALAQAGGPLAFCIDADTLLDPSAISTLAGHFEDPKVGAVAGNVKVGNRNSFLAQAQSVEYISSQNLDRRAYALLNAVTVVPGAIGMWRIEAVRQAGGYTSDTLAEDMDLTWRIRRAGWSIDADTRARAHTEAPERLAPFLKQRFRWSYGTLQCLWKHRSALCRHGAFGWFALPTMWLFQVANQSLAPIVDLQVFLWLALSLPSLLGRRLTEGQPVGDPAGAALAFGAGYALLFLVELIGAWIAFGFDKEDRKALALLFVQRFFYRQIMYYVMLRSLWSAAQGLRPGWGKLARSGAARMRA